VKRTITKPISIKAAESKQKHVLLMTLAVTTRMVTSTPIISSQAVIVTKAPLEMASLAMDPIVRLDLHISGDSITEPSNTTNCGRAGDGQDAFLRTTARGVGVSQK
jgi:hypothetical protein